MKNNAHKVQNSLQDTVNTFLQKFLIYQHSQLHVLPVRINSWYDHVEMAKKPPLSFSKSARVI